MKKIFAKLITIAGVLLALGASAETIITNEFWVCDTTNTANLGTLDNPFDASTQAKFDALMNRMPPDATIHLLAGTYETWGSYDWQMQSGQKILGSGRDNTIVQLPLGTPQYGAGTSAIYSSNPLTNSEIADLTIDCNWTDGDGGNYNYGGIAIGGTGNIVRRVRVIHCGSDTSGTLEAFAIVLGGSNLPNSQGNIIEDCEVSEVSGGHRITAIGIGGTSTSPSSGVIRNNVVLLSADPGGAQLAINCSWASGVLIEGNYVNGADCAVYGDTGGCTNMLITHNIFYNCYFGVRYANANRYNLTFDFNNIALTPPPSGATAAFDLWPGSVAGNLTNVIIFGNTIGFYDGSTSSDVLALVATNLTGLVFANNSVDSVIAANQAANPADFSDIPNLSMYNNNDLFGNYLSSLNIPTVGGVQVSSLGLNLISSAEASSALTNLGLPSNPATVITNNETGVTLSGTFNGNGGGLTNLNASQLTSGTIPAAQLPSTVITNIQLTPLCFGLIVNSSGTPVLTNSYGCYITNVNGGGNPWRIVFNGRIPSTAPYTILGNLPLDYAFQNTNRFDFYNNNATNNWSFAVFSQ